MIYVPIAKTHSPAEKLEAEHIYTSLNSLKKKHVTSGISVVSTCLKKRRYNYFAVMQCSEPCG